MKFNAYICYYVILSAFISGRVLNKMKPLTKRPFSPNLVTVSVIDYQLIPPTKRARNTDLYTYSESIYQHDFENLVVNKSIEGAQSYL